jgi:small redox-active disulfide protein 2
MQVEILGTGCKRCERLYENALAAVSKAGAQKAVKIRKVADINYFVQRGVFLTPGLVIDGEVVAVGKVVPAEEIQRKIQRRLQPCPNAPTST